MSDESRRCCWTETELLQLYSLVCVCVCVCVCVSSQGSLKLHTTFYHLGVRLHVALHQLEEKKNHPDSQVINFYFCCHITTELKNKGTLREYFQLFLL